MGDLPLPPSSYASIYTFFSEILDNFNKRSLSRNIFGEILHDQSKV